MLESTKIKLRNYLNYRKDHLKEHCISVGEVYLDKSISNLIIYLNEKGLKTYTSCSGYRYEHKKEMSLGDKGYIGFVYDKISKPILNKIEDICLEEKFEITKRYNPILDIVCMDIFTESAFFLKEENHHLIDTRISEQWSNLGTRLYNEVFIEEDCDKKKED